MKYFFITLFIFTFLACEKQDIVNTPPATFELKQNFPNPFNDTTVILYGIPSSSSPSIKIVVKDRFDQVFSTLVDKSNHPAGSNFRIVWNGRGGAYQKAPVGIYYIELVNSGEVKKRIVALKQ
jgi:hypothetical protein